VESVETTAIGNEFGALLFEDFPDSSVGLLGMRMRLGVFDAFVDEPGV
jgi:hypothetical protein